MKNSILPSMPLFFTEPPRPVLSDLKQKKRRSCQNVEWQMSSESCLLLWKRMLLLPTNQLKYEYNCQYFHVHHLEIPSYKRACRCDQLHLINDWFFSVFVCLYEDILHTPCCTFSWTVAHSATCPFYAAHFKCRTLLYNVMPCWLWGVTMELKLKMNEWHE